MNRTLFFSCALGLSTFTQAQAVLEAATRTIQLAKAEITCLVVSPKGDRILVGTDHGAELIDLQSGKRVYHFDFLEDNSTVVYHALFNDNGEYVMLAGFTGKREVFDVKSGEKEGDMARFRWLPNSLAMKALGLKMGNSTFDRYYQQMEARHEGLVAKADKDGSIVFTNAEGAALQTLRFPENKDQSYRAPCLFSGTDFITGTDNGRVLFYTLR